MTQLNGKPVQHTGNPLEYAFFSKLFYRDGFHKSLGLGLITGGALILSLALNVAQLVMRPAPQIIGIMPDGRMLPIIPLDDPMVTQETIINFTQSAVVSSFLFDFQNFNGQISANRRFYTEEGYRSYLHALDSSLILDRVKTKKLVASAVPIAAPAITGGGKQGGIYRWQVELPITVSLNGQSDRSMANLIVIVAIDRVPTTVSQSGIGISQIVAKTT